MKVNCAELIVDHRIYIEIDGTTAADCQKIHHHEHGVDRGGNVKRKTS